MKKWVWALAFAPMVAVSATIDREDSWVIPDLLFLDQDGDGIADQNDACAGTAVGKIVGSDGCQLPVERVGDNQLNIAFDFDQAVVKSQYLPDLQAFADILKQNPDISVELSGHTDYLGDDDYNQRLSERRADSVAQILVGQFGVSEEQLMRVGYSESKPLVAGDTDEQRALNRRVQAQLVDYNQGTQFIKTSGSE